MSARKSVIIGSLLSAALLFGGCRSKTEPVRKFPAPASFTTGLGKVYEKYLIVVDGLTNDRDVLAKNAMSAMHAALHEVPSDGLDSAAKAYWDSSTSKIMTVLHSPIAMSNSISDSRVVFAEFSVLLIDVFERYGVTTADPIFLFRCQASGNGINGIGGDWMQNTRNAANPYAGSSKPPCGEFIKEMKF